MVKLMAVHTLPYSNQEQMEAAGRELLKNMGKMPEGFNYKLTYCAFGDHKFFCDWDAPSKQALEGLFKQLSMPFDAVYPVKLFDMATQEWS